MLNHWYDSLVVSAVQTLTPLDCGPIAISLASGIGLTGLYLFIYGIVLLARGKRQPKAIGIPAIIAGSFGSVLILALPTLASQNVTSRIEDEYGSMVAELIEQDFTYAPLAWVGLVAYLIVVGLGIWSLVSANPPPPLLGPS